MLQGLALWEELVGQLNLRGVPFDELARHRLVRRLFGLEVTDAVHETSRRIDEHGLASPEDVRDLEQAVARFSAEMTRKNREWKDFLLANFYRNYRLVRMSQKAENTITDLFGAYMDNPAQLPFPVDKTASEAALARVVCDYIAGMTDRFAVQEHQKLFDPTVGA